MLKKYSNDWVKSPGVMQSKSCKKICRMDLFMAAGFSEIVFIFWRNFLSINFNKKLFLSRRLYVFQPFCGRNAYSTILLVNKSIYNHERIVRNLSGTRGEKFSTEIPLICWCTTQYYCWKIKEFIRFILIRIGLQC